MRDVVPSRPGVEDGSAKPTARLRHVCMRRKLDSGNQRLANGIPANRYLGCARSSRTIAPDGFYYEIVDQRPVVVVWQRRKPRVDSFSAIVELAFYIASTQSKCHWYTGRILLRFLKNCFVRRRLSSVFRVISSFDDELLDIRGKDESEPDVSG